MAHHTSSVPAIIPMSIATAIEHISGCLRRRGSISGTVMQQTDTGVEVTVKRLGHRAYIERSFTVPDVTADSPVTEFVLSQYAIAVGVGRVGEGPAYNFRLLGRYCALYRGLDGQYHITGQPDRVATASPQAQDGPVFRLVA